MEVALSQLQDEVDLLLSLEVIYEFDDVGVVNKLHELYFPVNLLSILGTGHLVLLDSLEGVLFSSVGVSHLEDAPVAALSKELEFLVRQSLQPGCLHGNGYIIPKMS